MRTVFGYRKEIRVSYSVIRWAASVPAIPRSYHRWMALARYFEQNSIDY